VHNSVPEIAALFVQRNGTYFGLEGVDPWDESRDAMKYAGPHPVVAHPPCSRWCRLAGLVEARWGHKRGDDGGTFAHALACVRRFGGVLEHPAYSDAWAAHDLNAPPTGGGWVNADMQGGWTCYVEQGRYGHRARKGTWLYAHGTELAPLRWGPAVALAWVSQNKNHNGAKQMPRLDKREASKTPPEFRDELIAMARSAKR